MTSRYKIPCPACGIENDAQTDLDDETNEPEPGDLSICFSCGHLTMFEQRGFGLVGRELTDEERVEVMSDEYVQRILAKLTAVMKHDR